MKCGNQHVNMRIARALISVSDKRWVVELAKELVAMGVEILSTGGTAKLLQKEKAPVMEVSEYTGFPEMMDGRVKTLHPKVHGGLLHLRHLQSHLEAAKAHDIKPIDLVVVNLYPFEETIKDEGISLDDAVEQIDIGGPAMLRSGAKNFSDVTVICDPEDYAELVAEMKDNRGCTSLAFRKRMMAKTYRHTAHYDLVIADYLDDGIRGPVFAE